MPPLRSSYAGLHLAHDLDERSAFGARLERAGGAAGISLAAHVLFLLLMFVVITRPNGSEVVSAPEVAVARPELVFLSVAGPGGGGGGGGNRTPAPPARLQTVGRDSLSVPILTPPPLAPPREQIEPRPDPPAILWNVPVKPMDMGQLPSAGAVDGSSFAPPASGGPGTRGGAGSGNNGGSGPGDGLGLGPGSNGGIDGGVSQIGNGITPPRILRDVKPSYTAEAMQARIEGEVMLSAIVRPDGTVSDIRVSRSLDRIFGLDEEAIKAVRQWRFKPATRMGEPVAVYVTIGVGFTMR